jgi:hypothetical protein
MYVVLLFMAVTLSGMDDVHPWEETLSKDGIVVFTREVDFSPIREFLAEAVMRGSIEKFKAILTNPGLQSEWLPNIIESQLVASSGPDDITYHMKLKVPFPFENRDLVQQLVFHESGDLLLVAIINQKDKVPELENFVRMPEIGGSWRVEELSGGNIKVQFQYFADPGGKIPAWLINTFVVKNPYKTLTNLRRLLMD